MADSLQFNRSTVFAGLGTASFTITVAGLYTVAFTSTIPYVASGTSYDSDTAADSPFASDLSVVINQDTGGGPVAKLTVDSPSPTQPSMGGSVRLQCDVDDVITVVFSSSAVADNAKNSVKSIINLYQGA